MSADLLRDRNNDSGSSVRLTLTQSPETAVNKHVNSQSQSQCKDVTKLDTSRLKLDPEAIKLIDLLKNQITLLRVKLKQANLEKERLNAKVGEDYQSVGEVKLEEAKQNLRDASKKLLEGDESPEAQAEFDKWDKIVSEHPEHIAQLAEEEAAFESKQNPINRAAHKLTCGFVPADIKKCSKADLVDRGLTQDLTKRLFERKSLWLVRMEANVIAKIHIADLRSKFSPQGLDLIEFRAIYYSLPVEFDNGAKSEWRSQLKRKLYSMIKKHEKGLLPLSQVRNSVYIDRSKRKPFPCPFKTDVEDEVDKRLNLEIESVVKSMFENSDSKVKAAKENNNNKTMRELDRSNLANLISARSVRGGSGKNSAPGPARGGKGIGHPKTNEMKAKLASSLFARGRGRGRGYGIVRSPNPAQIIAKAGSKNVAETSRQSFIAADTKMKETNKEDKLIKPKFPGATTRVEKISSNFMDALKREQKEKEEKQKKSKRTPKRLEISENFVHKLEKTQSALNTKIRAKEKSECEIPVDVPEKNEIVRSCGKHAVPDGSTSDLETDWECIEHVVGNLHLREQPLEVQLNGLENLVNAILTIAGSNSKPRPHSSSSHLSNHGDVKNRSQPGNNEYSMTDSVVMVPEACIHDKSTFKTNALGGAETVPTSFEHNVSPTSSPSLITQLRRVIIDSIPEIPSPVSRSPPKFKTDLVIQRAETESDSGAEEVRARNASDSDWFMVKHKE